MSIELDHLFLFTGSSGPEPEMLAKLGLHETYRRRHEGQGTANICYCFENAYLELLWLEDEAEAKLEEVAPTRLAERSRWRSGGQINPFGIAWRGALSGVECWPYRPSYLPPELSIAVARDSDDLRQPFMFSFPGSTAPADWPQDRRGRLQESAGFTSISIAEYGQPRDWPKGATLDALHAADVVGRIVESDNTPFITLRLAAASGDALLRLPDFTLL